MSAAWTIALQMLRNAIRSKRIFFLVFLLLFVTVFLPLTLKGDGTPDGLVRLTIGYTLGLVQFLLALTAIWSGCVAISADIAHRPLYMVMTKPVSPFSIWLGKWMGLAIPLGLLLAGSAAVILIMLNSSLSRFGVTSAERIILNEEVLVSRKSILPEPDPFIVQEARNLYQEKQQQEEIPAPLSEAEALRQIETAMTLQANRLEAGESRTWSFLLPKPLRKSPFFHLRYTIMAPGVEAISTEGRWEVLDQNQTVLLTATASQPRGISQSIRLPITACSSNGVIVLRFTNTDSEKQTVIFPPESPPTLLCRSDSFLQNYLRAVLILFVRLLFWTAIGVTAGCFFSQPVAVLFTGWLILLSNLSLYLGRLSIEYNFFSGDPSHRIMNRLAGPLYYLLHHLFRPLEGQPVLSMLVSGEHVGWISVAQEAGVALLLYGGFLAWLGAGILKRREIGLPVKSS